MRRPSRWPRRRPMDCHQVAQVLQTYLDGEIDAVTAVRISRHLEACRRCGMELRAYHEIKQALASRRGRHDPEALSRLRAFSHQLMTQGTGDRHPDH